MALLVPGPCLCLVSSQKQRDQEAGSRHSPGLNCERKENRFGVTEIKDRPLNCSISRQASYHPTPSPTHCLLATRPCRRAGACTRWDCPLSGVWALSPEPGGRRLRPLVSVLPSARRRWRADSLGRRMLFLPTLWTDCLKPHGVKQHPNTCTWRSAGPGRPLSAGLWVAAQKSWV